MDDQSLVRLASHTGSEWTAQAVFSQCDQYRYLLTREWLEWPNPWATDQRRFVMFVGLNPSTATEAENDPTGGFGGSVVGLVGGGVKILRIVDQILEFDVVFTKAHLKNKCQALAVVAE